MEKINTLIHTTDEIHTTDKINMTQEASAQETEVSLSEDNRGVGVVEIKSSDSYPK